MIIVKMGGNALKNKEGQNATERLNKKYYNMVKNIILQFLKPIVYCDVVPELPGKETYGDLDILYRNEKNIDVISMIKKEYNPKYFVKNGGTFTFSFDCEEIGLNVLFQIDCKCVSNFEMVKCFDAYSDIGTIIGMMTNYCGLKYGSKGLWYNVTKYDMTDQLLLSANPIEIFKFLDLEYDFFVGIVDMKRSDYDRIFEWIVKSKFFKSKAFIKIDKKNVRPFFKLFLEYIDEKNIIKICDIKNIDDIAIKYFNKEDKYLEIIKKFDLCNERKMKFNGKMLIDKMSDVKGIKINGKKVGIEIDDFKKYCVTNGKYNDWNDFLDKNTRENVAFMLDKYFGIYDIIT
jgi:hypothetical protein